MGLSTSLGNLGFLEGAIVMKNMKKLTRGLVIAMMLVTGLCKGMNTVKSKKEVSAHDFEQHTKGASIDLTSASDQQSPVMINTKDPTKVIEVNLRDIIFNYTSKNFAVINTGHSTELKPLHEAGESAKPDYIPDHIIVDEIPYNLAQFHFHTPSEHTIDGKPPYPMEVHFVHTNETIDSVGNPTLHYAVIGVFIEIGAPNPEFEKIISKIPKTPDPAVAVPLGQTLDLTKLFPKDHRVFRYSGSLTTEPYTTGVRWLIMKKLIQLSLDQVNRIQTIMGSHVRALQELKVPVVSDVAIDKSNVLQP